MVHQDKLRQAEAALRQTQKLESLGLLTGGVAHDFNNLLAVFANGLQVLERTAGTSTPPPPRVFDGMRRAIARGTGLTHHLLAFSRRRPVNPESIDLVAHLLGMREMLDGSLAGTSRWTCSRRRASGPSRWTPASWSWRSSTCA